jgi:hypothetical protein
MCFLIFWVRNPKDLIFFSTYLKNFKEPSSDQFTVQIDVFVFCHNGASVTIATNITEINLSQTIDSGNLVCNAPDSIKNVSLTIYVPVNSVNLWYPNGYGDQSLYNLKTQVLVNGWFLALS